VAIREGRGGDQGQEIAQNWRGFFPFWKNKIWNGKVYAVNDREKGCISVLIGVLTFTGCVMGLRPRQASMEDSDRHEPSFEKLEAKQLFGGLCVGCRVLLFG
jgi:hypothetical protein